MNLEKIEEVIKQDLPALAKERLILTVIVDDPQAIPTIMKMLDIKHMGMEALISESNLELSRALVALEDKNKKPIVDKGWVAGEIRKHFLKWQHRVKCCFKMNGLP